MPSHEDLLECVPMQQHAETPPRSLEIQHLARRSSPDSFCLIPFDRREGITTAEAAWRADRTERTIRMWCRDYSIGRHVAGGPWIVSRVALAMLLNDDAVALRAYLAGDRGSSAIMSYFASEGLADLTSRWCQATA